MLKSEQDILQLIREDEWMMDILKAARSLNLPDWWICAGFVRTKIWDTLHGFTDRTSLPDVDVIYFDKAIMNEADDKILEEKLKLSYPAIPWSVKNEARMHYISGSVPYLSSVDAISKFPETASALGLKLNGADELILAAPWGIADAIHMEVKPTPFFMENRKRAATYEERIMKKNWKSKWGKVRVHSEFSVIK